MAEDFIEDAIKHPGSLRATAEAEGALTEKGTIKRSWLDEKAKGNDTTARRARLAINMRGMKK